MGKLQTRMTSIDLFSGAGGLSEGLREAGFECLYANEIIPTYAQTYAKNHANAWVGGLDIREVNARDVRTELALEPGDLDLLAGGPPCQGFSINAPKRSEDDDRNHLFKEYLRFVQEFKPKAVLIENVPGLVSFSGGATLEAILQSLRDLGYTADVQILYAPHYGVPQTRWRTIIIGLRGEADILAAFPQAERQAPMRINFTSEFGGRRIVALPGSVELPPHTTVVDAIGDLPALVNGQNNVGIMEYATSPQNSYQLALRAGANGVYNHEAPKLSPTNMERLKYIPAGGNWTDIPLDLLPEGMKRARRSDHTKRYGRVDPRGLASTILTKCDPHWGAYFHYDQDRSFTVREAARLQSFPDTYVFTGAKAEQYAQVGNAVPPLLAAAVGQSISAALGLKADSLSRVV